MDVERKLVWTAGLISLMLPGAAALAQAGAQPAPSPAVPAVPVSVFLGPAQGPIPAGGSVLTPPVPAASAVAMQLPATAATVPMSAPVPASVPAPAVVPVPAPVPETAKSQIAKAKAAPEHHPATVPVATAPQDALPAVSDDAVSSNAQPFDPAPYVYSDNGRSVVLGRYSTSSSEPPEDLVEPIDAVVSLTFPRQTVRTIADAIRYTLMRSGYSFNDSAVSDAGRVFLDLPLPESQRQIGPYSLYTMLNILTGSAWRAEVNRINRTVSMALRPAYAVSAAPSKPVGSTASAVAAAPPRTVKPAPAAVAVKQPAAYVAVTRHAGDQP